MQNENNIEINNYSKICNLKEHSIGKKLEPGSSEKPEHEKLFDEICDKLNQLSHQAENRAEMDEFNMEESFQNNQQKIDKIQSQLKKVHSELYEVQEELLVKIKSIEGVQCAQNEIHAQLKQVTEQLQVERGHNTKLNAELAKSLELCLQLQVEIQNLKAKNHQIQIEEKRFSQSLQDRIKQLSQELDSALLKKEEIELSSKKAIESFEVQKQEWERNEIELIEKIETLESDNHHLQEDLETKNNEISNLNQNLESLSQQFTELEESATQQNEATKNLAEVAESKIVELKLSLDRKALEAQDYYGHLQQVLAQVNVLKQENQQLKEYIHKMHYIQQQQSRMQGQPNVGTTVNSNIAANPTVQAQTQAQAQSIAAQAFNNI